MIHDMTTETVTKKRFSADEFHRMCEVGIFPEDSRFELIRGEIIEMPSPKPPHSGRVNRLIRLFTSKPGESVVVSVQNPFLIDSYSEPFPDVALLKPRDDFYQTAHPGPDDVLLLVEVSHTTVSYDARIKAPLYAESGAPEYWQLDLQKDVLIVRGDPRDGEYHSVRILRRGEAVTPEKFPTFHSRSTRSSADTVPRRSKSPRERDFEIARSPNSRFSVRSRMSFQAIGVEKKLPMHVRRGYDVVRRKNDLWKSKSRKSSSPWTNTTGWPKQAS